MEETSEELPNFSISVFDKPIGTLVYFFVRYENFALYHNKKSFFVQILDVAMV